jgi:hypothetical protein
VLVLVLVLVREGVEMNVASSAGGGKACGIVEVLSKLQSETE